VTPDAPSFLADLEAFLACHFEPVSNLSVYAQFKVMKELSRCVKVALDGQGNDEQFAGYDYFFGAYFRELLLEFRWWTLAAEAAAYVKVHRSTLPFQYLAFYSLPGAMKKRLRERAAGWIGSAFADAARDDSTLDTRLFSPSSLNEFLLQHFEYKLEHNLKWNDLNSMYFSVELRTPYMDFRVVERTLATEPGQKINGGYTKWLQREALRGVLPDLIRCRSDKIGFDTPAGEWFRAPELTTFVEDLLGSRALADSGFLDIDACRQRYAAHLAGRVDASRDIWKWVHLSHFLNGLGAAAETPVRNGAVVS
jgi:asparagine synthase (glutamine-hydrolysing)